VSRRRAQKILQRNDISPSGKQMERSGKSDEKNGGKDIKLPDITFKTLFLQHGHLMD